MPIPLQASSSNPATPAAHDVHPYRDTTHQCMCRFTLVGVKAQIHGRAVIKNTRLLVEYCSGANTVAPYIQYTLVMYNRLGRLEIPNQTPTTALNLPVPEEQVSTVRPKSDDIVGPETRTTFCLGWSTYPTPASPAKMNVCPYFYR